MCHQLEPSLASLQRLNVVTLNPAAKAKGRLGTRASRPYHSLRASVSQSQLGWGLESGRDCFIARWKYFYGSDITNRLETLVELKVQMR